MLFVCCGVFCVHVQCPVVFAISDNQRCISLPGYHWVDKFTDDQGRDGGGGSGVKRFVADGSDVDSLYWTSQQALQYSRSTSRPSVLLMQNLPRRFGHAATDRQFAYMSNEDILRQASLDPLAGEMDGKMELENLNLSETVFECLVFCV